MINYHFIALMYFFNLDYAHPTHRPCRTALRNGPKRAAKRPISPRETAHSAT